MSVHIVASFVNALVDEGGSNLEICDKTPFLNNGGIGRLASKNPNRAPPLHTLARYLSDRFTKLEGMTDMEGGIMGGAAIRCYSTVHSAILIMPSPSAISSTTDD
ncbi:hypothetical protein V8B97DRAFT_1919749 [Scleroderma yunnanense]